MHLQVQGATLKRNFNVRSLERDLTGANGGIYLYGDWEA